MEGPIQNAAVIVPWDNRHQDHSHRTSQSRLEEITGLACSIKLEVVHQEIVNLRQFRSSTLIGKGQIANLKENLQEKQINVVIFDTKLSPIQQRNLEELLSCKVIDRTALILDIFGERAQTKEGSLQVELAHLQYQRSRLVRSWTHLERQRGGFGFLGGPGETQIEADRRLIDERIVRLKKDLEQVRRTRRLHREARKKNNFPVIALVGYTNAGKSTLFNYLTQANVYAQDQLFATLDPTMRKLKLPSGREVIFSDTVGFISDLPTELVAAFRATLEEICDADIILHVRDITHPETNQQKQDVHHVLDTMVKDNFLRADWSKITIEVLNKIDLDPSYPSSVLNDHSVGVSALTGKYISNLIHLIEKKLSSSFETITYHLPLTAGSAIAWLYQHGEVIERKDQEQFIIIDVRFSSAERAKFERYFHSIFN